MLENYFIYPFEEWNLTGYDFLFLKKSAGKKLCRTAGKK